MISAGGAVALHPEGPRVSSASVSVGQFQTRSNREDFAALIS